MKYKIGDKVWIKKLQRGSKYGTHLYSIAGYEKDISEKLVTLISFRHDGNEAYKCKGYSGITDEMIDHKKTATIGQDPSNISYEIY
jgi:hypothetical protein